MSARYDADYVVALPGGGSARCNPVIRPAAAAAARSSERCPDAPSPAGWPPTARADQDAALSAGASSCSLSRSMARVFCLASHGRSRGSMGRS